MINVSVSIKVISGKHGLLKMMRGSIKTKQIPAKVTTGNNTFKYTEDIANCFHKYFTTRGANSLNKNETNDGKNFETYLSRTTDNAFKLRIYITATDVIKFITELKPKFTQDANKLLNRVLRDIKHKISTPLALIINQSFPGVFPDKLKIA